MNEPGSHIPAPRATRSWERPGGTTREDLGEDQARPAVRGHGPRALAAVLAALALGSGACGAGRATIGPRLHRELAAVLSAETGSDAARRAREALASAERAESVGLEEEAAEHASRARSWAAADLGEREVTTLEEELGRIEEELLGVEARASASEHEAEERRARTLALADARAAREELARALARAEADEGSPRRARRVGLSEGPVVQRLADVLADRARVLLAAARRLGAAGERVAACEAVLASIDSIEEPTARLAEADRAHALARAALAEGRHRAGRSPGPEEIASLVEALESEGFVALRDERGLGARLPDVFVDHALSPAARGRLRRLGELVASYPSGPILLAVESDASPHAQAQASRRLEALRRAILAERTREVVVTIAVERRAPGSPAAAPNAARVILPAYVPRSPEPLAPGTPSPAATTPGVEASER